MTLRLVRAHFSIEWNSTCKLRRAGTCGRDYQFTVLTCHRTYIGLALYRDRGAIQCIRLGTQPTSYQAAPSDRKSSPIHRAFLRRRNQSAGDVSGSTRATSSRPQSHSTVNRISSDDKRNFADCRWQVDRQLVPVGIPGSLCYLRCNTLSAGTSFPDNENGIWKLHRL